jgi:hypothetical protein
MLPLPLLLARILPLLTLHKKRLWQHVLRKLNEPSRPTWTPHESEWKLAVAADDRAAAFDRNANCIWRSPALVKCDPSRAAALAVSGHNWCEFIALEDLDRLVKWLLDPTTEDTGITFTAMDQHTARGTICRWRKTRLPDDHWLVFTAIVHATTMPGVADTSIDNSNTSVGGGGGGVVL